MESAEEKPKYSGYGYHGGGRKPTGKKYKTISFSCSPEEYEQIRELIEKSGKRHSRFFVDLCLNRGDIQ